MASQHDEDDVPQKEAKASPDKPLKPVKPVAKPAAAKPARPPVPKAAPEKRVKPPAPEENEEAADEEEPAASETAVQKEPPAKAKKKAKPETGIATKPGRSMFSFNKAAPAGVWGVDLGQCALKAIRLEVIDGEVTATAFDYVEHPKILSQPDADPDELTREALAKFLSRNTLRGDTVAISVPGQSGLARFVKLPPVEEKKIPDIVKFEAKQQIPFNLDEVVWDYQKLGVNELAAGFVETEIGLFAMKRDMVSKYLQHFKDVGVEVHLVQMAPLSLCNFVAYDLLGHEAGAPDEAPKGGKRRCVTALDIGADSSNLVITDGSRIIWQRPIPLGGNHFTRALTKDLKLTFAKAEHLKRNAVKSPDLKKILASLKPVLADFVGEVQRSLGYFTNTHRDAQIEYMVGLGNAFRLPGMQRYLAEKLQMEVRKLGKMERLTGDSVVSSATYTENILSFAVAYGLALQGLKKTKLQTNLLPSEIRAERAVRGKKPWAAAAAALLMLGLGGYGFSYYLGYQAYGAEVVGKAVDHATATAKTAGDNETKFTDTKTAALKEEEAVKSIIAGQAERKNWLELTRYLFAEALPRPDGSNLSDEAKKLYWDNGKVMSGQLAYQEMLNRQGGKGAGAPKEAPPSKDGPMSKTTDAVASEDLGVGIDDLIQVNIEYFDQRFADDLGEAWKKVKDQQKVFSVSDPSEVKLYVRTADPEKPPEAKPPAVNKGWVVEIHGYTYHNEARAFLARTLADNIYRLSVPAASAPPPSGSTTPPPGTPPGTVPKPAPSAKDAYLNLISHVVLFDANDGNRPIVGQSVLDPLVKAGDSSATGQPTGTPGGTGAPTSMTPGGTGAPSGAPGATPSGNGPAAPTRDGWKPLSPFMASAAISSDPGKAKPPAASSHTRTEFVVVFFWKEPTPSDSLRGEDIAPPKPAATSAPATTPGSTAPATPTTKPDADQ